MKSNEPENLKGKYTSVSIQVQKKKKILLSLIQILTFPDNHDALI